MKYSHLFALAACLATQAPATVALDTNSEANATVSYGDLDLSTVEGTVALEQRIERAAHRLCRSTEPPSIAERKIRSECFDTAVAKARNEVRRAVIAADHGVGLAMGEARQ